MKKLKSFLKGDLLGVHLAVNIFIATTVLWLLLRLGANTSPIWAISAMIPALDPQMKQAVTNFRGRIGNALLGCVTGLSFLLIGGPSEWKLPLALSATVLLSSYVIRIPAMWRQAPITAAIIIAAGLTHHSKLSGVEIGLKRVGEVMLGCMMGLLVSWLMSKIWPVPESEKKQGTIKSSSP
ncbi:MAG TPA: FUSC family protein [Terrimicrobiaceae bacterium]